MCDVLVASGEVFHNSVDFDLDGFPQFTFRRSYTSTSGAHSSMGLGWQHNWDIVLRRDAATLSILESQKAPLAYPLSACDGENGPRLLVDRERNVIQMSYSDGRRLAFRSDNNRPGEWLLTERVDSYGNWTQLAYQAGRLAQIKDSSGRHVELSYGGSLLSNINLRHRGVEQNVRFDHDAKGRLVRAVNPLGHAEQFEYDDHLLVRYVDETGVARRFCYDERKRCILNWYQDGLKVRRLDFGADDRTVILHDSNGFRDVYRLDNGRIVSMTDPLGRRTQWIYDSNGGLMCRLMPDGRPFEVGVWDQEHRVLRATDSRGAQTEYVYDRSNGRAVISNGIQSLEITQDGKDNVAALKTSDGAEWRFEYDSRGSMKRFVNPVGDWIERQESEGDVRAWDAGGILGTFKFDALGNLLWGSDALGRKTSCEYAGQNLLTAMIRPDGSAIRWAYDARGRIISVRDGLNRETRYEYSPFGSVVRTMYPDGSDARIVLDNDENLRAIVNSKDESCRIEHDEAFREKRLTLFDGRTITQEFDVLNQATAVTDARGRTNRCEYDGANNPVRLTLPDGTVRTYSLNAAERITDIQQTPPDSEAPALTAAFTYNASNYVIGETHNEYDVQYPHDLANNLNAIRDNLGRDIQYTLGAWGAVQGIQDGRYNYALTYSRDGELIELRLPGGMVQRFEFDLCSRLVRREVFHADGRLLAWRRFEYDAADQLTAFEDWRLGVRRFDHDLRGRLIRVTDGQGTVLEAYEFDSEGNLLASPHFAGSVVRAGNRLLTAGSTSCEYDAEGCLVRMRDDAGEWAYEYDGLDQLERVSLDGRVIARYQYDLIGRRTAKLLADEEIQYRYHVNVLAEMTSTRYGRWRFLFLPFTFVPITQYRDDEAYFYSWDQAGVPTELWREDGTLAVAITASAFGADRNVTRFIDAAPPLPFHFMGQIVDEETTLHYNRYRYYSPRTARFTCQDPFGLAAGLNLYTYPTNPLNVVDPLGLAGLTLEISCVPSEPPPFTACEQAALQAKVQQMNGNLQKQGRKARCTSCRENEQKDYFIKTCNGHVPPGWQVDHIQELQVGGADKCCANLMAIPARPNGSCGSQIYHQVKDYGGTIVGAIIKPPGCKTAHTCKSGGVRRGNPPTGKECDDPNPIC